MFVYRIVKSKTRTNDLSGTGAYSVGGRWNSKGVYMLYTSENRSLAYLETLVHFDETEYPPNLYIMKIEIDSKATIYTLKEDEYPGGWLQLGWLENKLLGDKLMQDKKILAVKVRSAVTSAECNYLLNPLYPRFYDLVKVVDIQQIILDKRLIE